jgi:hypothetical protein
MPTIAKTRPIEFAHDPARGRRLSYHAAYEKNPHFESDDPQVVPLATTYETQRRVTGSVNFDLTNDPDLQEELLNVGNVDSDALARQGGPIQATGELAAHMIQAQAATNPTRLNDGMSMATDRAPESGTPGMGEEYPPDGRYPFNKAPFVQGAGRRTAGDSMLQGHQVSLLGGDKEGVILESNGGEVTVEWSDGSVTTEQSFNLHDHDSQDAKDWLARHENRRRRVAEDPGVQPQVMNPGQPAWGGESLQIGDRVTEERAGRSGTIQGFADEGTEASVAWDSGETSMIGTEWLITASRPTASRPTAKSVAELKAELMSLLQGAEIAARRGQRGQAALLERKAERIVAFLEQGGTRRPQGPPRPVTTAGFQDSSTEVPMDDDDILTGFGDYQT